MVDSLFSAAEAKSKFGRECERKAADLAAKRKEKRRYFHSFKIFSDFQNIFIFSNIPIFFKKRISPKTKRDKEEEARSFL